MTKEQLRNEVAYLTKELLKGNIREKDFDLAMEDLKEEARKSGIESSNWKKR